MSARMADAFADAPDYQPKMNGGPHAAASPWPLISDADASRWIGVEPPEQPFTIEEYAPEGVTTVLVADGGAGKTMLLQTAATCVPCGLPFLGKTTASGNTAGLFAEDPDAVLHRRQARINSALGVDMEALSGRAYLRSYAGLDATLWTPSGPTDLLRDLEQDLARIDELRLFVIDNAALVFSDDENHRGPVTRFLNYLNGMAARLTIAIILSMHTSKSSDGSPNKAASGSTAWIWAARSAFLLTTDEDPDRATLKLIKSNYTRPGSTVPLVWRQGVLTPDLPQTSDFVDRIERHRAERVFLELLDRMTAENRPVSESINASNYAPKLFASLPDRQGLKRDDFRHAMETLFAEKAIKVETYGRKSDERRRIARASEGST